MNGSQKLLTLRAGLEKKLMNGSLPALRLISRKEEKLLMLTFRTFSTALKMS